MRESLAGRARRRALFSREMSSDGAKLVRAARTGDDAKVKRLLKAKVDVNHGELINGRGGVTALQVACANGHVGAVRLLLKRVGLIDMGLIHLFMM